MESKNNHIMNIAVVDLAEMVDPLETALKRCSTGIRIVSPPMGPFPGKTSEIRATAPDANIEDFALFLVRVRAPIFEGIDICRVLKSDPRTATVPVILVGGDDISVEDRIRCYEAGAHDVCPLSVDACEMAAKIRVWVHTQESQGVLRQKTESERVSLEKRLRQSQKLEAVGTLAAGIAHDFNNILAAIMGFADLVKLQLPPGGRAHRNVDEILVASKRARALVGQILAFSRQSGGDPKPVDLGPIIGETIEFLRATLPGNVRVITSVSPDSGLVLADSNQMQQVILHLTTNAVYAMREKGGILEFIVRSTEVIPGRRSEFANLPSGKYVQLTVHDSGVGMDRSTLDRVFEPYFTTKPVGQGSGLGLAVVHGIISNHHGSIQIESALGKGTSIHLFLPRLEGNPEPITEQPGESSAAKGKILVVDDESVLVKFLIQGLEYLGYQAIGFEDSRKALEAFAAAPETIDLIITDQCMPDLEGVDLAAEIHKIDPRKPVILTSGFNELPEGRSTRDIDALLVKPMALGDLEKVVAKVLKQYQTSRI